MKLSKSLLLIALGLSPQLAFAGSGDNYLSKAFDRYSAEMLGYPKAANGSIDWNARNALYKSGAMNITRPGSGAPAHRSCVTTDYEYSRYFINTYLKLTVEEARRFAIINHTLFNGPTGGMWASRYMPNRRAILSALQMVDPGQVPTARQLGVQLDGTSTAQERMSQLYNAAPVGNKLESADNGAPIDQATAFERFVAWNESQAVDMGRYSFWKTMTYWAVAHGVKDIATGLVSGSAASPIENTFFQLKEKFYYEMPQFSLNAKGYPVPNQKFLISQANETTPIMNYLASLPDQDSPNAGSAFLERRAEKLQLYLAYVNDPGHIWTPYYAWARTSQQKAFFDWVIFRYDPHDYGCDDKKEVCWSGRELMTFPGQNLPTSCENDFLKDKSPYQGDPASYTFKYNDGSDEASRKQNLNVISNCYCSDI